MFKNILVGVDGSEHSRDAVALAQTIAGEASQITLAHVHPGHRHPRHAIEPDVASEEQRRSDAMLEAERSDTGVNAELLSIVADSPGAGLHAHADQNDVDLIVVGSCHRGVIGRVMVGDNARAALNGAPCAVAIASRGYVHTKGAKGAIGVAYNQSAEAARALDCARELAGVTGEKVIALQVIAIPTYAYTQLAAADSGTAIDAVLDDARERVAALDGVDGRAEFGLATEQLASFGDEVDLLLVGSRSYGPLRRLVLGSTSDYLERHARCSLLVLPRPDA